MPGSRTIFVANLPYDVSEEQLGNVFSEVGPVNSVEIKFDPQTGRSKGYAFVQYMDEATAASAVRNLQDVPVNGRNLRVETSDDSKAEGGGMGGGPGGRRGQGGGAGRGRGVGGPGGDRRSADIGPGGPGGPGGPYFDRSRGGRSPPPMGMGMGGPPGGGGYGRGPGGPDGHPPFPPSMGGPMNPGMGGPMGGIDSKPPIDMNALPPGQDVPPGQKATDIISKTLAAITPGQMQDVMMGMKTLVSTQPDQARLLLQSKPQLAYALFQAMLLMNIVDASVLQRIQPVSNTQFPPAPAPGPPAAYPPYPPQNQPAPSYPPYNRAPVDPRQPPHQAQGYNAPPFPPRAAPGPVMPASIPPHAQAALATLPEDQRTMLIQVLQLTPDQVNALDATQKASIVQLRQQFLGTA